MCISTLARTSVPALTEKETNQAPHKLDCDPTASRRDKVGGLPDDRLDVSEEREKEASVAGRGGPGTTVYQDYCKMQCALFFVAHLAKRGRCVKAEMAQFFKTMDRYGAVDTERGMVDVASMEGGGLQRSGTQERGRGRERRLQDDKSIHLIHVQVC